MLKTKIIHIFLVILLLFSLALSSFCVIKIRKLEGVNKDFESKIKTLTKEVNAVDDENSSLKRRLTNLGDDFDMLRADFDDHRHY